MNDRALSPELNIPIPTIEGLPGLVNPFCLIFGLGYKIDIIRTLNQQDNRLR